MKMNSTEQPDTDLELSKAVAQAWISHSSYSSSDTKESDMQKGKFKHRPSRFKLEAEKLARRREDGRGWDFAQSLWDPYEIVSVSKRIEFGLVLDGTVDSTVMPFVSRAESGRNGRKARESRNSLRKLFHRSFSRKVDSTSDCFDGKG